MRIVQFRDSALGDTVAKVDKQELRPIKNFSTTCELALEAQRQSTSLNAIIEANLSGDTVDYAAVLASGAVLPPVTHPDPSRLWITGTGLTHLGSASARDKMHAESSQEIGQSDTMKMFHLGLEGGKPEPGKVGVQPEWFFKGNGNCAVSPGAPITSPHFALLDGEEIEICAFYIISEKGEPCRIGYALGNEFSDHKTEKLNYLYLAHSKLRSCSYGPELLIGDLPHDVRGRSRILRNNEIVWEEEFLSGEQNMSHSLANLEYHHFKYDIFRRSGDLHCHFLGTATASFSKGIAPQEGDIFEMEAEGFGAPLKNQLRKAERATVMVRNLYE